MSANIFMLFDCFLDEDQEVPGYGKGHDTSYDRGWDSGDGISTGEGDGWGSGYGIGGGYGNGEGYGVGMGSGNGVGGGGNGRTQPTLCLVEVRRSSDER